MFKSEVHESGKLFPLMCPWKTIRFIENPRTMKFRKEVGPRHAPIISCKQPIFNVLSLSSCLTFHAKSVREGAGGGDPPDISALRTAITIYSWSSPMMEVRYGRDAKHRVYNELHIG